MLKTSLVSLRRALSLHIATASYMRKWLVLGVIIGAVGGLGAVVFVHALDLATHLLLDVVGGFTPPTPLYEGGVLEIYGLERAWAIPFLVALGGLVSGLLVHRFAPEAAGGGADVAIAAVHQNPKGIRPRASLVKMVASAITIGSGGSGGREGPTAQVSAGFASYIARAFNLSQNDARIAVTIGMGAGIGAIFRTPLGGAVVGAEILYRRDFETAAIIPGLIASIVAFVVFGAIESFDPIFGYHAGLVFDEPIQILYYAIIGVVSALVALLYHKSFWAVHDLFQRVALPSWLRPAIGGLLVGCLALVFPQVLGTGYGWVQAMMTRDTILAFPLWFLLLLPFAKILATNLSIGSGGSGGIIGPGMVIGALVGGGVWRLLEGMAPGVPLSPAPFIIVGMMACFGSIGHIPIATMLMVAEMTGNLSLLAPAMVAVGVATLIVGDHHIFRSQIASREDAPAHRFRFGLTPVGSLPITSVVGRPLLAIRADEPASSALGRLATAGVSAAPVTTDEDVFVGILAADTERAEGAEHTAGDIVTTRGPVIAADSTLDTAIEQLAMSRATWAPVVDGAGRLVGTTTSENLLRRYTRLVDTSMRRLDALAGRGVLFEGRLTADSKAVGKSVCEVDWPPDTFVLSVRRGDETVFATDETTMMRGDEIVVVTRPESSDQLTRLLGLPDEAEQPRPKGPR
jgi:H+/Cl- antiporter ClcA